MNALCRYLSASLDYPVTPRTLAYAVPLAGLLVVLVGAVTALTWAVYGGTL